MNIFYKESPDILFLDIDGPLLPGRAFHLPENKNTTHKHAAHFDRVAVALFNDIFEKFPNLKVVFSTTWANHYTNEELFKFFEMNGLHVSEKNVYLEDDRTPKKFTSNRYHEIKWWLDDHPEITNWVAIDDDIPDYLPPDILNLDRVVRVNFDEGFLFYHYLKTLTILGFDFETKRFSVKKYLEQKSFN